MLRLGGHATACVHLDPDAVADDPAVRGLLAYATARLLLAQVAGSPGDAGHGWLESGVSHVFEARFGDGRNIFTGFGEVVLRPRGTYRGGDWLDAAKRLAESGTLRTFAALAMLQHEELDLEAHAQARAFVEFLLAEGDGPRLLRAVRATVDGGDPVEVFNVAWQAPDRTLDQRFSAWLGSR